MNNRDESIKMMSEKERNIVETTDEDIEGLKIVEFNVDKGMKKKQNKTHNNKKGGM